MNKQDLACDEVGQVGVNVFDQILDALNKENGVIITIEHPLVGIAQRLHAKNPWCSWQRLSSFSKIQEMAQEESVVLWGVLGYFLLDEFFML